MNTVDTTRLCRRQAAVLPFGLFSRVRPACRDLNTLTLSVVDQAWVQYKYNHTCTTHVGTDCPVDHVAMLTRYFPPNQPNIHSLLSLPITWKYLTCIVQNRSAETHITLSVNTIVLSCHLDVCTMSCDCNTRALSEYVVNKLSIISNVNMLIKA